MKDCCGKSAGYGFCSKCKELRELTRHHSTPQRRYPSNRNSPLVYLCRPCHDIADELTFVWEDYGRSYLIDQCQRWLRGELDDDCIDDWSHLIPFLIILLFACV